MPKSFKYAFYKVFVFIILLSLILSGCRKQSKDLPISSDTESHIVTNKSDVDFEDSSQQSSVTEKPKSTSPIKSAKSSTTPLTEQKPAKSEIHHTYSDMKCIWLSQYDCNDIFCENGKQRNIADYKSLISVVLNNIKNCGLNTIFVQMRPNADSIYPSDYYPPSIYAVGKYGKSFSYDPVAILLEEAHNRQLSVHAWINPLRAVTDEQMQAIPEKYPLKQWYNDVNLKGKYIVFVQNRWYLNPAYPEVQGLILSGVKEMLSKYTFDGLHMDDYFYPTSDAFFDSAAYTDYQNGGGTMTLDNFRRSCLNTLVKQIYNTVKSVNSTLPYGISPSGVVERVYQTQYADVYLWCSERGYIDYICPQVYFGFEHQTADFKKICNTWSGMISENSGVNLIIGMTLGKALDGFDIYAGTGQNEWAEHKDILKRCLEYTDTLPHCIGVSFYCYQYFFNPVSGESVVQTQSERDAFLPILSTISWQ